MMMLDCTIELGSSLADGFGGMTGQQIAVLAAIIIIIVGVLNMRRRRSPDTTTRTARGDTATESNAGAGLPRDLQHLMVQLEELSRSINAQIDTKFAKLEQSISDADKRIVALRTLLEYPRSESKKNSEPPRPVDPPVAPGPENRSDDRFRAIYELADQGMTPVEIAQKLGRRTGEIELILNLRGAGDGEVRGRTGRTNP